MVPRIGQKQTLQKLAGIWDGLFGMVRAEHSEIQVGLRDVTAKPQ